LGQLEEMGSSVKLSMIVQVKSQVLGGEIVDGVLVRENL
jgi:hypothetical protein